jgi:hypothetical protein
MDGASTNRVTRRRAIRRLTSLAAALSMMIAVPASLRGVDDSAFQPRVNVTGERGVYSVKARFVVPQSPGPNSS